MNDLFENAVKTLRLEHPDLRILWLMLGTLRDDAGNVTQTVKELAYLTGLDRPDVRTGIDRLIELDLIRPLPTGGWHIPCVLKLAASASASTSSQQLVLAASLEEVPSSSDSTHTVAAGRGASTFPHHLMARWNALVTHLPKARLLDSSRAAKARRRLHDYPTCDWDEVIRRLDASPFCRGENSSGWVANFDFLLRPTTVPKTLEGLYDARPKQPTTRHERNVAAGEAWLASQGFTGSAR